MSQRQVLQVFEQYQRARTHFVQAVAELSARPQNIGTLRDADLISGGILLGEATLSGTHLNIFFRNKPIPPAAAAHHVWYWNATLSAVSSARS